MDFHRSPRVRSTMSWISIEVHETLWMFMNSHNYSWTTIEFHEMTSHTTTLMWHFRFMHYSLLLIHICSHIYCNEITFNCSSIEAVPYPLIPLGIEVNHTCLFLLQWLERMQCSAWNASLFSSLLIPPLRSKFVILWAERYYTHEAVDILL